MTRLLATTAIPSTLWDANRSTLVISPCLARCYGKLIQQRGLANLASIRDPNKPPVGGLTAKASEEHFAQAFDGSVARLQLALLDPHERLGEIPDAFLEILTGDRLLIVDAPCGAGAAAFSLLACIHELRASGILPRFPLDVTILGAELSVPSRTLSQELFSLLGPALQEQSISVTHMLQNWDVTDKMSNTDLINIAMEMARNCSQALLIVANFNSFLEKERKRNDAEPQLEELFRHMSQRRRNVLWIEPKMNAATAPGGLFTWLLACITSKWHRFANKPTEIKGERHAESESHFYDPLYESKRVRVGLAVLRFILDRGQ